MAHDDRHTRLQRLRAEPGQNIGGAAAQDLGDLQATANGEVVADPVGWWVDPEAVTRVEGEGRMGRCWLLIDPQLSEWTGDRDPMEVLRHNDQAAKRHLDHSGRLRIAHEPVRQPGGGSIGGTGRGNAEMRQAGSAEVLDQRQWPGLLDEDHDAVGVN